MADGYQALQREGNLLPLGASSCLKIHGFDLAWMKQQKNHYPHLQINVGFLLGLSGRQRQRILGDFFFFFFFLRNQEKAKADLHSGGCGGGDECIFSSCRGLKPGQYLQPGYLLKFSCDLSVLLLVFPPP